MPELEQKIMKVIKDAKVPLVTSEIAEKLKVDRRMLLRRLQRLAIEGKIKGRRIDAANGIWIWWRF
jgi:DNA-binding Lrp family transcriptional regulator